jgi:hypothetical protein
VSVTPGYVDNLRAQLADMGRSLEVCSRGFDAMAKRALAAEAEVKTLKHIIVVDNEKDLLSIRIRELEAQIKFIEGHSDYARDAVRAARATQDRGGEHGD